MFFRRGGFSGIIRQLGIPEPGTTPAVARVVIKGEQRGGVIEFQVCRRGREARWVVTLGNTIYGAYLDREQALLDAVEAARDALAAGQEAQVWIKDRSATSRVF